MRPLQGGFWYLAPFIFCNNQYFRHEGGFPLPFDNLPQTNLDELIESEEKDRLVWPPDGWSAMFGCFACGFVDNYVSDDVNDSVVQKDSEGVFHSDGVCICVEALCGDGRCRLPAKWYVDISGATESDLLQRLRSNHFFGTLPCGHEIRTTIDKSSFRLYRVMNRLWK
jgi:hypothetical protein